MDKYQEFLINKVDNFYVYAQDEDCTFYNIFANEGKTLREFNSAIIDYNSKHFRDNFIIGNEISIKQIENINIKKYIIFIANQSFSNVECVKNGNILPALKKKGEGKIAFAVQIDFDNRISSLIISFKDDLAEAVEIPIKYIEADKEAYYAKVKKQKNDERVKEAKISHSTGADLVNIYFQPCDADYSYTEITLYKDDFMLAKYNVDSGCFFKSISGLAFGEYEYIVKQFKENGELLLETDKVKFRLSKPNYGNRHVVIGP